MSYYCPCCGQEAYRGHRDYKCDNEECINHENPVFGLQNKPIAPEEVVGDIERLSRYGIEINLGVTPALETDSDASDTTNVDATAD